MNLEEFLTLTLEECSPAEKEATESLIGAIAIYSLIADEKSKDVCFTMPKMDYSKDIVNQLNVRVKDQGNDLLIMAPRNLFQPFQISSTKIAVRK